MFCTNAILQIQTFTCTSLTPSSTRLSSRVLSAFTARRSWHSTSTHECAAGRLFLTQDENSRLKWRRQSQSEFPALVLHPGERGKILPKVQRRRFVQSSVTGSQLEACLIPSHYLGLIWLAQDQKCAAAPQTLGQKLSVAVVSGWHWRTRSNLGLSALESTAPRLRLHPQVQS